MRACDEIDITRLDGSLVRRIQLAIRGMTAYFGEISPDGQQVAFVGGLAPFDRPAEFGLHLITASGAFRTLVHTSEASAAHSIGWSSDSTRILYDEADRVYAVVTGSGTISTIADGSYPSWSPDGSWIAFRRPDGTAAIVSPDDGAKTRDGVRSIEVERGLRWSPDSRYVLFTARGTGEIRTMDLSTGHVALLLRPRDQYTDSRLRWAQGLFVDWR
jgi:Tol biopolymer transport system component